MFLTLTNLPYFLMSRGLLESRQVISGEYISLESRRRNRNLRVLVPGKGLFIKQVPGVFQEAIECIEREALCYVLIQSDVRFQTLIPYTLRFHDYDSSRHALVVELSQGAENLHEMHARLQSYPLEVAQMLGRVLGTWHRDCPLLENSDKARAGFASAAPWIFSVAEDERLEKATLPGSHRQAILYLRQNSEWREALASVRELWRSSTLIHGDIRGDNLLIVPDTDGRPGVRFVDWELGDIGDPMWDVAGVLVTYLEYWLLLPYLPVDRVQDEAFTREHEQIRHGIQILNRTFWITYCETRKLAEDTSGQIWKKCQQFTAVRLLRSAFDVAAGLEKIPRAAQVLFMTAHALLTETDKVGAELFNPDE